jgi:zinc/manganese transport system permease protein/manganese/iron transport system permease protein
MMELVFGPGLLFRNAVLGGLLVALLCSLLGVYVVLRRLVLLGVALPQAGAAGIAAAFWLTGHAHQPGGGHTGALLGSLGATFGALALLLVAQRVRRSPAEWGIGALFAMASSATVLFVALNPTGDLEMTNLLRGELLSLGDTDLGVLAAATVAALLLFFAFRREILLASFDPEFAQTVGRRPGRADALLFALLGIAIALGVMDAGPVVVFGFLVLPALAALRVAPSLGAALAISAAIGVVCSVTGFALAYRADLPTGPTSVALAAGCWLAASGVARLWPRVRRLSASRAATALSLLAALLLTTGCASLFGERDEPSLSRGTLPDLGARGPVVVARFRNETGNALRIPSSNPLREIESAVGASTGPDWKVTDALQQRAVHELARRGVAVLGFDADRKALPDVPTDPGNAARSAKAAGIRTPVLFGSLRRFSVSDDLLQVQLDLALVDPESSEVLWKGSADRPVSVKSALTLQEVVLDAGPEIFAEAFGG